MVPKQINLERKTEVLERSIRERFLKGERRMKKKKSNFYTQHISMPTMGNSTFVQRENKQQIMHKHFLLKSF